ncbi:hypothetical protein [Gracilimonas amylolytica]|uniref:hypothetical protein n=1 Tax=Gracilimonas amylolytica TaxID=1749045 RepID=UPI000CD9313C|nr:hypothetical protein [Gracilimonas amylolytica]
MNVISEPTKKVIFWAFILNTIWEFVQCGFLYGMWDWPFLKATVWMWGAVLGDIIIVLGLWRATSMLTSSVHLEPRLGRKGYIVLFGLSFAASIFLEWVAIFLSLWEYTSAMPELTIFSYEVGLSPIVQITVLPALSIYLASKRTKISRV